MKKILYLFSFLFLISCGQSHKDTDKTAVVVNENQPLVLENTKWEWKVDEDCINYLEFEEDGIYHEFNCELGEKWEGNYQIKKDTLILKEKTDTNDVPAEGETVENEYKMILSSKGLCVVYSRVYEDGNWKENWIKEPTIYYRKSK